MRTRLSLEKDLRHRETSPSLVSLHFLTSSASIGGIRQFVLQNPSIYVILMGYWVAGQVRTMRSSFVYTSKFSMEDMTLSMFLMIPYDMFLRAHLRNTRSIDLLISGRV